jgi:hypothetical protein
MSVSTAFGFHFRCEKNGCTQKIDNVQECLHLIGFIGGRAGLRKTISQKMIAATPRSGLILEGLRLGAMAEFLLLINDFAPKTLKDQTTRNIGNRDRLEEIGIAG